MVAQNVREVSRRAADHSVGGIVENGYNDARDQIVGNTWRGLWDMAAGGFGKAALSAAASVVAGTALVLAGLALTGQLTDLATAAPASPWEAFTYGAQKGAQMLAHPMILGAIGAVGLGGGWVGYQHEQKSLAEAQARAAQRERAQAQEAAKAQEKSQEKTPAPEKEVAPRSADIVDHPLYDRELDGIGGDAILGEKTAAVLARRAKAEQVSCKGVMHG